MNSKEAITVAMAHNPTTRARGKPVSSFSNRNTTEDLRVSVCTNCRRGIFKNHMYVWTSNGLVHIECIDNEVKTES